MERNLIGSAFVLGLVAWLCSLLLTRADSTYRDALRQEIPFRYRLAAIVLPLLGFVASLPTRAPFAAGQGMGRGLLLGAFGALLATSALARSLETDARPADPERHTTPAFVAPFALAVVCAAIPLLWMRDVVVDALLGTALGWLTSSLLLLVGLNTRRAPSDVFGLGLLAGTGFAATLCALGALGEIGGAVHFGSAPVPWSAPLLPLAAFVPFVLLLSALPPALLRVLPGAQILPRMFGRLLSSDTSRHAAMDIARWLVGSALLLFVGTQFALKLEDHPNLFRLLGMGLLASGLSWWLITARLRALQINMPQNAPLADGLNWHNLALPVLIFMAAGMVAFQMLAGAGVGVMLLGAWLTAGVALLGAANTARAAGHGAPEAFAPALMAPAPLLRLLFFGTLLLLYRLFQVRFDNDLHNVLLPDHYALLGFIVGAAAPTALAGYLAAETKKQETGLMKALVAGVLTLFLPAVLLVLFGTKCLLCLFFGLALAAVLGTGVGYRIQDIGFREGQNGIEMNRDAEDKGFWPISGDLLAALFALAMGLALAQWTRHVLPVTLMARADKIHLLTYGVGIVAVLLLIADIGGRLQRKRVFPSSPAGSPSAAQKGGAR